MVDWIIKGCAKNGLIVLRFSLCSLPVVSKRLPLYMGWIKLLTSLTVPAALQVSVFLAKYLVSVKTRSS